MIKYQGIKVKLVLRKAVYYCLYFLDTFVLRRKPGIFIFGYHAFGDDNWKYSVNVETFKSQVDYLLKKKYTPVSLYDLDLFISGKKELERGSFAITIDDGYKDVWKIKEYCKKNNIIPAIFVLSERTHANRKELETERAFLSLYEIRELEKDGWNIGLHSATHADFHNLSHEDIKKEIITSKSDLEKQIGMEIKYFAYPKGRYTNEILRTISKASYSLCLSMNSGYVTKKSNKLLIPRIGVDRTYSMFEFKSLFLPSSVTFRNFVSRHFGTIV